MICSKCGAYNPDYYVFCQDCFADLSDFGLPDGSELPQSNAKNPKPAAPKSYPVKNTHEDEDIASPILDMPADDEIDLDIDEFESDAAVHDVIIRDAPSAFFAPSSQQKPTPAEPKLPTHEPLNTPIDDLSYQTQPPVRVIPQTPPIESSQRRYGSSPVVKPTPVIPQQDDPRRPSAGQSASISSPPPAGEIRRQRKDAEREHRELQKLQANQGSEYYDYYDYYDEAALRKERRRSRVVVLVFWLILIAAIATAIGLGVIFLNDRYGGVREGIEALFTGRNNVVVEADVDEETKQPFHRIIIAGKKGQKLVFKDDDVNQSWELVNTKPRAYKLMDSTWIPTEPDENQTSLEITPSISLIDPDGTEHALEVPTFTIEIPKVDLVITEPTQLEGLEIEGNSLQISGKATAPDGSPVQVYVQGYILGNTEIDDQGNFSCQISVTDNFDVEVVAKSNYKRKAAYNITGTAAPGGQFIINEKLNTPVSTDTITISGKAPFGGTLQVSGTAGDISYDEATGDFSFVARLPEPGMHEFTLKVGEFTHMINVRRVPEVNEYTSSAQALDYDAVLAAPSDNANKPFYFDAAVAEIVSESPVYVLRMAVDGNTGKMVDVTYYGSAHPNIGERFRVYANANGNSQNNSAIRFNAYFMYTEESLAQAQ